MRNLGDIDSSSSVPCECSGRGSHAWGGGQGKGNNHRDPGKNEGGAGDGGNGRGPDETICGKRSSSKGALNRLYHSGRGGGGAAGVAWIWVLKHIRWYRNSQKVEWDGGAAAKGERKRNSTTAPAKKLNHSVKSKKKGIPVAEEKKTPTKREGTRKKGSPTKCLWYRKKKRFQKPDSPSRPGNIGRGETEGDEAPIETIRGGHSRNKPGAKRCGTMLGCRRRKVRELPRARDEADRSPGEKR